MDSKAKNGEVSARLAADILEASSHYEALNLPLLERSTERIRSAYKAHALLWHPDKSDDPDAHLAFIRISEAFDVLRNDTRKSEYDKAFRQDLAAQRRTNQQEWQQQRRREQESEQSARRQRDQYTTKQTQAPSSAHFSAESLPKAPRTGFSGSKIRNTPTYTASSTTIESASSTKRKNSRFAHVKSSFQSASRQQGLHRQGDTAAKSSESIADQLNRWKQLWAEEQAGDLENRRNDLEKRFNESKSNAMYKPMDAYTVRPNVPTVKETLRRQEQQQRQQAPSVSSVANRAKEEQDEGKEDDIRASIMARLNRRKGKNTSATPSASSKKVYRSTSSSVFENRPELLAGEVFSYSSVKNGKVDVSVWVSHAQDELLWRRCGSVSNKPDGAIAAHRIFKICKKAQGQQASSKHRFAVYHGSLEEPLQFTLAHPNADTVAMWVKGLLAWVADHNVRHQLTTRV